MSKLSKIHPRWSPKNVIFPSTYPLFPSKFRFSKASNILSMLALIFVRSGPQLKAILGPKLALSRPLKSPMSSPRRILTHAWELESAQTTSQDAPRPPKTLSRPAKTPKLLQNAPRTPQKEALIFDRFWKFYAFKNGQICSHRIDAWKTSTPQTILSSVKGSAEWAKPF